jgi:hypothetical protein
MSTLQLYDDDEGYWHPKLHVGCGGIYLMQYINVDIQGVHVTEVSEQEINRNARFISDYYQKLEGTWDNLPEANPIIADVICPMQDLTRYFGMGSIQKIVAIQTMEHLDPIDFINTLDVFYSLLDSSGIFILSVPDIRGTLEWLDDPAKMEFAKRHLLGSKKDDWSTHKSWWTQESLKKTLDWVGFKDIQELLNFHCYPAVVMKAIKR